MAIAAVAIVAAACSSSTATTTTAAPATTTTAAPAPTTTAAPAPTTTAAPAPAGEALNLASLLPITGDLSAFGPSMQKGVELAVQQANEAGGVHGSDISFKGFDTGTSPDVAGPAADEIIAGGFQAEIGAAASGISLSVIDKLTQAHVVMVSPSNTSPQFSTYDHGGFYFRTAPSDALQGQYTAALLKARGADNVAIIYRADSYGEGLKTVIEDQFDGTVVGDFAYEPESVEAKTLISNVKATNPGAVVCICFPETGVPIHQEAFKQDLLKDDQSIPWFYTDGMLAPDFVQNLVDAGVQNAAALLAGFQGTAAGAVDSPQAQAFKDAYNTAYGEDFALFSDNAYDGAWLVILAAQASDGTSEGIQSQMVAVSKGGEKCFAVDCLKILQDDPTADIDYVGATGEIDFKDDGSGDPGSAVYQIWSFQADGTTATDQIVQSPSEIK